jgi:tetratricopeptide (TPR) repeat protein
VGELRNILPVIESAKRAGIGSETELLVEEELVKNIISMAENEQNGVSMNRMAQSSYDRAVNLEKTGDLTGALSLYYTAYTISNNRSMKDQSLGRANVVMDRIYLNRVKSEVAKKEGSANGLFNRAIAQKNRKQYTQALSTLEELVKSYPETSKVEQSFEEIKSLNRLILMQEEQQRIENLNRQAALVMKQAEEAYDQGLLSESLDRYGELVSKYYASDYVGEALKQITRISEVMRSVKATPQVVFGGTDARTGVIIQIPAENTFLFNLGLQDGLKQGDVMGVFRKEGENYIYVGSVKVFEVYPTVSRGRTVHIEKPIKVGDLISPS